MKPLINRYLLLLLALVFCTGMIPKTALVGELQPALIVLSDQRFNPTVQRLLAREELKALPIGNAGVIFVIPVYEDPMLEAMQIRYLEQLINTLDTETAEPKKEKSNEPAGD